MKNKSNYDILAYHTVLSLRTKPPTGDEAPW